MLSQKSPPVRGRSGWIVLQALFALMSLGLATVAYGQTNTVGTISGTVKDPNGATIPKTEIVVVNQDTGLTRTVYSDDSGSFAVESLPVGKYTVTASIKGFKKIVNSDLELTVNQNLTVNMVLPIGELTETVNVTAEAVQVETKSGEVSTLVTGSQIKELPINGRNYAQLALLIPGVSPAINGGGSAFQASTGVGLDSGVDLSVNGNGSNQNLWTVDGVNNMDVGSNRTLLVFPSVDSIAEFRVERNSFSAEFGEAQGAVINLITKGGGNQFHGAVWEFIRNDKLDATDFFLNAGGAKKQELRYNNYGFNVSGPIKKDRLFFFWSEEWRRQVRGFPVVAKVPTAQERVGDFSGVLTEAQAPTNPFNGNQPFANNVIPSNLLSPGALALMKIFPLPTNPDVVNGNNFFGAPPQPTWNRQDNIRGDATINSKMTAMVRYIQEGWTHGNDTQQWGDNPFPTVASDWSQPSYSFAAKLTYTLSPTSVNEFQFSRAGNDINITNNAASASIISDINSKIPSVFPHPGFGYPGVFAFGPGGYANMWHQAPWSNHEDLFNWKDDFSKVLQAHELKIGGLISHNIKDEQFNGNNTSIFTFGSTTSRTGTVLGDYLLAGLPQTTTEVNNSSLDQGRWHDFEFYGNDTWKARPNFTVSVGLRWSRLSPGYDSNNQMSDYVLSQYDGSNPLSGLICAGQATGCTKTASSVGLPNSFVHAYNWGFQPRLGVAWDIFGDGKTSLRLGFGRFISRTNVIEDINRMAGNAPWSTTVSDAGFPGAATSISQCNKPGACRSFDAIGPNLINQVAGVGANTAFAAVDTHFRMPESVQWNMTISREVMKNTVVEVSYIGNHGYHLWRRGISINDINPSARLSLAEAIQQGSPTQPIIDANRNFKGLGPVTIDNSTGTSRYNALQATFTRRFSERLSVQASYSWSHNISDVPVGAFNSATTDPFNYALDRGDSDLDRRQTFVANFVYNLPSVKQWGLVADKALGGWQLNGIFTYFGGSPVIITDGANTAGLSNAGNTFRPNLVPGVCIYNCFPNDPLQYLNPAAFSLPAVGTFGTLGAGSIRFPAYKNIDFSIDKNFRVKERFGIQFRAEMFNAFNNPQFTGVDANLSLNDSLFSNPTLKTPNPLFGKSTNGDFGRLTADRQPREIQFGLKFTF
ncbi:MAG TPA: carboxypeptidase regulatory-like domain-containing protein [Blastocatellia bacterium]|nr:carboxypeptidase regulatory-like domain-containing protein [Blastocatellia bacterium]